MVRGLALGDRRRVRVRADHAGAAGRLADLRHVADDRLSYPLTYWNALGLLAAVGTILCFHLTCSRAEPPAVRVLGAAAVPLLVTTLFFTFSRGAIAAGIVGLVAYVVIGRPRRC